MYVINEWFERYEVNDKGQPARIGDKLRVRPLDYIRSKCHGKGRSAGFAYMQDLAGEKAFEVFGLFHKFLEIAGDEVGGKRGILLNSRGNPATSKDLAIMLNFPQDKIEYALEILTNEKICWLKDIPEIPGKSGKENGGSEAFQKFQENQEIPGKSGKNSLKNNISSVNKKDYGKNNEVFQNFQEFQEPYITEPNRTEPNRTEPNRTEGFQENKNSQQKSQVTNRIKSRQDDFGLGNFNAPSFRFRLVTVLEKILEAHTKSDRKSLQNLFNWLNMQIVARRFDENIFQKVLDIAKESKKGSRNPMAVFFAKLDELIGYRAKVAKQIKDLS